jgi:hypothetical protein
MGIGLKGNVNCALEKMRMEEGEKEEEAEWYG